MLSSGNLTPSTIPHLHLNGAQSLQPFTAYGLQEGSIDLAVLGGERGKAALNLAKLVLIDMVKDSMEVPYMEPGLSLQGSTTAIFIG